MSVLVGKLPKPRKKRRISLPYRDRACERPIEPPSGLLMLKDQHVAYLLGISVEEARRLRRDGTLPTRKFRANGHPRVPRAAVLRLAGCG